MSFWISKGWTGRTLIGRYLQYLEWTNGFQIAWFPSTARNCFIPHSGHPRTQGQTKTWQSWTVSWTASSSETKTCAAIGESDFATVLPWNFWQRWSSDPPSPSQPHDSIWNLRVLCSFTQNIFQELQQYLEYVVSLEESSENSRKISLNWHRWTKINQHSPTSTFLL